METARSISNEDDVTRRLRRFLRWPELAHHPSGRAEIEVMLILSMNLGVGIVITNLLKPHGIHLASWAGGDVEKPNVLRVSRAKPPKKNWRSIGYWSLLNRSVDLPDASDDHLSADAANDLLQRAEADAFEVAARALVHRSLSHPRLQYICQPPCLASGLQSHVIYMLID